MQENDCENCQHKYYKVHFSRNLSVFEYKFSQCRCVCLFLFFYFYLCFVVYLCPFSLQVSLAARDRLQIFESLREKQKSAKATEAPLSIRLPDGRTVTGTAGVTTPLFVAQSVR